MTSGRCWPARSRPSTACPERAHTGESDSPVKRRAQAPAPGILHGSMAATREIEDIARSLVKHQHDHPPVRDLNRESDRRLKLAHRVAEDLGRLVGSWTFVL